MVVAKPVEAARSRQEFDAELTQLVIGVNGVGGPVRTPECVAPSVAPASPQRPADPAQPTIRELPNAERPRERLRQRGSRELSNTELVAILLRTGMKGENAVSMASRIMADFGGLAGLARADYGELIRERGLSDAKACQVMAALELGRRVATLPPAERPQISCAQDAVNLIAPEMAALDQENLVVLLLDTRNRMVLKRTVYMGTVNSSAVRPAEVLRPAIRENVPSIIVAHNHPSGDPAPSPEDVAVTRDLVAAGKLMDIELHDHLIIGAGGSFTSLRGIGSGFEQA